MRKILDLNELSAQLKIVDNLFMQLILRRMELAEQVGLYKWKHDQKIFRAEPEDSRIAANVAWGKAHGLNPHFVEAMTYMLIDESCKQQMIDTQDENWIEKKLVVQNEEEWYETLKTNLLKLTERWHETYDVGYENSFFATRTYIQFEWESIKREIEALDDHALMLDLGCATGRITIPLADSFDRVIGYDISQHMIARANQNAEARGVTDKVSFETLDFEEGIPIGDSEVSFVVMNLGTAGDIKDISKVIGEIFRVLKPGGRFLLSFYNLDGLIYRWGFLPWATNLAAHMNLLRDCLEVYYQVEDESGEGAHVEKLPIFARPRTMDEVRGLLPSKDLSLLTYPAISPTLPQELFEGNADVQVALSTVDRSLADTSMGSYIIATGSKY